MNAIVEWLHGLNESPALNKLNHLAEGVNAWLWPVGLLAILVGCGLYFTVRTRLAQLRMLPEMLRLLPEGFRAQNPGKAISSFQAFCVSSAGRVGVGNVAGVAIAIVTGGPGAVFWMWVIAFFSCATGFVESTLAQIYKRTSPDGKFYGGPAYYIQGGLGARRLAKLFAALTAVTAGFVHPCVQSNTIALSAKDAFGVPPAATAAALAVVTAVVILGGIRRIARFTEMLVPLMAGLYVIAAMLVTFYYLDKVPGMISLIVHDAFSPQAAVGGIGGAVLTGLRNGIFSNEAGEGSVPNAAATADVTHPVKQGLVQALGVYVDTWVICTATAFIVLLSGKYVVGGALTGIELTQASIQCIFGDSAPGAMSVMIVLFAFSTILSNCYYGEVNLEFFEKHGKATLGVFRFLVVAMATFGCLAKLELVWNMAYVFMGLLCLTNLYAVARLSRHAVAALQDYVAQKRQGVEEPVFAPAVLDDAAGVCSWGDTTKTTE